MVAPTTQKFHELVIEMEVTPGSGTFEKICGLIDATVTRTANLDTVEVPVDCTDESLPLAVEKSVRSLDVSISGTGVWAAQSAGALSAWFYSSATKLVRVTNALAATGDNQIESGPALIANLSNERTKGQKVTANFEIQFDGTPALTVAP